jgi:hypothetical protein
MHESYSVPVYFPLSVLFPSWALKRPRRAWCIAAFLLAGCSAAPVHWVGEAAPLVGAQGPVDALALRGESGAMRVVAHAISVPGGGLPGLGPGACVNSVRWARAGAHDVAVAWWVARADSSVVLRLVRSRDDGAHWDTLPAADARDRGVRGCARPPPAVALDPLSGYTHLAYYLEPDAGAGVYYEHLMDLPRAGVSGRASDTLSMFHAPVALVYGEGLAETSVAGHGDTVVVAYQDPNVPIPQLMLAVSVTAGHSFQDRVDVSGSGIAASAPVVALEDDTVAVAWRAAAPVPVSAQPRTPPSGQRVVRVGVIQ